MNMENKKPIKKNHIKEFGGWECPRSVPEINSGRPICVEIHIQGAECLRDRRDRWRDRWDMSTGQNGTQSRGCPAKILYVYWFFSFPNETRTKPGDARGASEVWHGTSSIHFHCPAPQRSNDIGHGVSTRPLVQGGVLYQMQCQCLAPPLELPSKRKS